ncbi:MAG: helix-turn-helix transcriptional regulator [Eggerthellaceae bacterium]|nr:helix-turn-helix transcriptional regulator [Eggerthellaceae bacterium]
MRIQKILADNLRSYRKRAGLTQEQLAEKSGLHRTYIGGIEQQRINVSLKNIERIASALEIDPVLLMIRAEQDESGIPRQIVLDKNEYALLSRRDEETVVTPIDVSDSRLSFQILTSLVIEGYTGDKLISMYEKTQRELFKIVQDSRRTF